MPSQIDASYAVYPAPVALLARLDASFSNLVVLHLPRSVSAPYIAAAAPRLAKLGVSCSAAPNSVWLKRSLVSKARPVRWLEQRQPQQAEAVERLDVRRAVAFGDNPTGNDSPPNRLPRSLTAPLYNL